jgi:hypothetical protein
VSRQKLTAGTPSGEGDNSTPIPDSIGKLEIVIREVTLDEEVDSGDSSEDESDGESEDSEDSSGECDDSEDETYEGKTGKVRSKPRPQGKSPKELHDIFPDWCEKKPRHTHTAVYAVVQSCSKCNSDLCN